MRFPIWKYSMPRLLCFLLVGLGSCPSVLQADGFHIKLLGHRQLGFGNAGTAFPYDPGTVFFNPGGMVIGPRRNISLGAGAIIPFTRYEAQSPSIYEAETERQPLTPGYFYGTYRRNKDSRLAVGLSVNNPFGISVKWPDDWKGRYIVQQTGVSTLFIQPTLSFRLSEKIGIGAGFVYAFGSLLMRQSLPVSGPGNYEGSSELSGRGSGFGLNAGLYLQLTDQFSLGLSYRSPVTVNIRRGDAIFNVPESLQDRYPDNPFSCKLKFPQVMSLGAGIRPRENLFLSFEVNFTGWAVWDILQVDFEENTPQLRDIELDLNNRNAFTLRVGGEYNLNEKLWLRSGGYFETSPVRDGYVSPAFPDANRIGLSCGLGTRIASRLSLDAGFLYEFSGDRTAILNEAAFAGTYRFSSLVLGVGGGYVF
jgi:long-chain fatty acid transport protein